MRGRTISGLEASRQKTNLWLKEIARGLRTEDRHRCYSVLRAVLHVLRDCMPVEEAAKFSAQMPLFITGLFFDGWKPRRKPLRLSKTEFYARIREQLRGNAGLDSALATRVVLGVIERHLSEGEVDAVRRILPSEVRELWADLSAANPLEELPPSPTPGYSPTGGVPAWP